MSVTGYDRRELTIAATSVAVTHWHQKALKHTNDPRKRSRCYGIADEFQELHDTLIKEKAAEAGE